MENDTNKKLNELFNKAKNEPSKVSYEETKEQFLNTLSGQNNATKGRDFTQFFNLKLIIMIASIITTIALVLVFKPNTTTKTVTKVKTENTSNTTLLIETEQLVLKEQQQVVTEYLQKVDRLTSPTILLSQEKEARLLIPADSLKRYEKALVESVRITELLDTAYQFPRLTPEEIAANNKQKAKMVKQLDKLDKKQYAFIPAGTFKTDDKNWSVQAYYMQTTEVTNLEYRTFLFDLLINDHKEAFLAAKPDQSRWVKDYPYSFNKPMEEHYFSHAAYNEYPVLAISRKGAEMYCVWLTEEVNKQRKKGEFINDVRLPSNYEWMYAASGGKDNQPYPWGGAYLKNSKGCYLANYQPIKGNFKEDGAFHTTKVDSYIPNDYGLYCMSGNVAEMVFYENENQLPGTKGGSWTSLSADIQINGPDKFKGVINPSVDIGFRPVISYFDKMINPPGTVRINNQMYMDETETTNFNWQEYVMWIEKTHGKTSNEYKNSLPDTTVWNSKESLNEPYVKYYYSHPAYRDYPVVGVSYEQAIAFCKWRTDRVREWFKTKELTDKKNIYPSNFEYRLPTKEEWEKAANIGYSLKTQQLLDTKHNGQVLSNLKRSAENNIGVASNLKDNTDVTAPVKSYWPNAVGCYNLIGNVAEMTNQKGIAKGGSWINSPNEISIEKEFTYTKPSVWLGFRCVAEITQ